MGSKIKRIRVYRKNVFRDDHTGQKEEAEPMLLNVTEYHPEWGKPILESQHNQFGDAEQQTLSEYNDTGFLVREVLREPDGEILEEKTFEPDDQQRVKKEFRHYLDGTFDVLEFFYDEKGHVVRKILSDDEGEVETEEVFEYRNGLLMKETLLESGKEPIKEPFIYMIMMIFLIRNRCMILRRISSYGRSIPIMKRDTGMLFLHTTGVAS